LIPNPVNRVYQEKLFDSGFFKIILPPDFIRKARAFGRGRSASLEVGGKGLKEFEVGYRRSALSAALGLKFEAVGKKGRGRRFQRC